VSEAAPDALPVELDVTAYVGPYLFPTPRRRLVAGACLVAVALIFTPLVLAYQAWTYWVFRARIGVASVGADREGNSYNINADEAAGAVARALGAYKIMFLTDVAGWMRDPADPQTIVSQASAAVVQEALPSVSGGMRPKLAACIEAIHGGVSFAHIVDGRVPHSLLLELFTDAGQGTKIGPGE